MIKPLYSFIAIEEALADILQAVSKSLATR
jgi:hypothetical protein